MRPKLKREQARVQTFDHAWARNQRSIRKLVWIRERVADRRADVLQEIQMALWAALPHLEDPQRERAFVMRVALNVTLKHISKEMGRRAVQVQAQASADAPSPHDPQLSAEAQQLFEAIRALEEPDGTIVSLSFEGFSGSEIAEVTGLSAGNVRTRLNRAKARLREQFLGGKSAVRTEIPSPKEASDVATE